MTGPRRRTFGPLFYSTLGVAVLVATFLGLVRVQEWQEVRSLASTLHAEDPLVREAAAGALARKGSAVALPYLLEAARDPRGEIRGLACRSLVDTCTVEDLRVIVPVLVAAAGDGQEGVRGEAALALGRMAPFAANRARSPSGVRSSPAPTPRAVILGALRRLLKDRAGAVRVAAADALRQFDTEPASAAALVEATGDEDREVRFAAARALLKVNGSGDHSAVRTLIALVADPEPIPDRRAILDVLMLAGDEVQDRAVAALAGLLSQGDPSVHPDVIDCLLSAGPRARLALPALEGLLHDEDPGLRGSAGLAIATIEDNQGARAVALLIGMVADATLPLDRRHSALGALFENKAALAKATPALIRQLGDQDQAVRMSAAELLISIVGETPAEMPDATGRE